MVYVTSSMTVCNVHQLGDHRNGARRRGTATTRLPRRAATPAALPMVSVPDTPLTA
jgi:hypothetical protein